MKTLNPGHTALKTGTTLFLKQVKAPTAVARLLQPASANAKLSGGRGQLISKGKWKGMPMYSLSLEERKTCPKSCQQWANCYGNNMPFANRIDHKHAAFTSSLTTELDSLASKHPQGFVVRLHVLGDFYSVSYAKFWEKALTKYSGLRVFGYTHRPKHSPIGRAVQAMNDAGAWIRWSDATGEMSANCPPQPGDIVCPEQLGKTAGCGTCGLCWSVDKPIGFLGH